MGYSNVKTPSFYMPYFDYLHSIGKIEYHNEMENNWWQPTETTKSMYLLNPAKVHTFNGTVNWYDTTQIEITYDLKGTVNYKDIEDEDGYIYLFILGHNFYESDCQLDIQFRDELGNDNWRFAQTWEPVVNATGQESKPNNDGFSIIKLKFSSTSIDGFRFIIKGFSSSSASHDIKVGSVVICTKYTPPQSPDISLEMKREFDGVETITTKGGASLSNMTYYKPANWGDGGAWELYDYESQTQSAFDVD